MFVSFVACRQNENIKSLNLGRSFIGIYAPLFCNVILINALGLLENLTSGSSNMKFSLIRLCYDYVKLAKYGSNF